MSSPSRGVTFVIQEGTESTGSDQPRHPFVDDCSLQIAQLINPDFVLQVGDGMRVANRDQLHQFLSEESSSDACPLISTDKLSAQFPVEVDRETQSLSVRAAAHGIRFIRIKSVENSPPGLSQYQRAWLSSQLVTAQQNAERVVVLHDEHATSPASDLSGAGIEGWRELMATERPVVVVCGHSHYWRLANNGLQVSLAARWAVDKPIRAPGYLIGHFEGDDFAAIYRTVEDSGPAVMITHPRDQLLSIGPQHTFGPADEIRVRIWSVVPVIDVVGTLDQEFSFELRPSDDNLWTASLAESPLQKGVHRLRAVARSNDGSSSYHEVHFRYDQTRREVNSELP